MSDSRTPRQKERPTDGEQLTDTSRESRNVCPECGGTVLPDEEHGETTCDDCGLILQENALDRGPEWRSFDNSNRDEKSRVGAPVTPLMHDKGLSTTISWQDRDAAGSQLSASKRKQLSRLRTWDERFRTKTARERNLKQAFGEIDRMASALGLSEPCRETAGVLYRRALEADLLPGRSIEGMATASLYAAAREHGTPRTLAEFATVSRVERIRIQRAYRYLSGELDLQIEHARPSQYLPQFASQLDVSDEAIHVARDLLDAGREQGVFSGKSPAGLAAAAVYAASRLTNERLTQQTVSDATNVSKVTVRNRYQELLEAQEDSYE